MNFHVGWRAQKDDINTSQINKNIIYIYISVPIDLLLLLLLMGSLVVDLGLDQLGLGEKDHNKEKYRTNMFKNKFTYSCKWKKKWKENSNKKIMMLPCGWPRSCCCWARGGGGGTWESCLCTWRIALVRNTLLQMLHS